MDPKLPIPYRWFYRQRRPTDSGKRLNAVWAWVWSLGLAPSFLVALETKGRRTGRPRVNALVAGAYQGERYLVSMLGEHVDWVRNVRASDGEAAIRRFRRCSVRLEEVPVEQRAPIIQAYLRRATGARHHFDVAHDAPMAEFERIAGRHPVFRIVPRG